MTIIFYFENTDQKKELESMLTIVGKRHFKDISSYTVTLYERPSESKEYSYEQVGWSVYIHDNAFLEDLQRAKENVYKQNKENDWHYLDKNPDDLPEAHWHRWVVAKYNKGALFTRARREEFRDGIKWVNDYHYAIQDVEAWKEVESTEILLTDFLSDIEENLSFVPKMETL